MINNRVNTLDTRPPTGTTYELCGLSFNGQYIRGRSRDFYVDMTSLYRLYGSGGIGLRARLDSADGIQAQRNVGSTVRTIYAGVPPVEYIMCGSELAPIVFSWIHPAGGVLLERAINYIMARYRADSDDLVYGLFYDPKNHAVYIARYETIDRNSTLLSFAGRGYLLVHESSGECMPPVLSEGLVNGYAIPLGRYVARLLPEIRIERFIDECYSLIVLGADTA